jgi:hypothetical protein
MHHIARFTAILVFLAALAPRAIGVGTFVTVDEPRWIHRSEAFLSALRDGDYAHTNQTGHPGVTTMWMGSAGILLTEYAADLGIIPQTKIAHDLFPYLALLRLPVALMTSLCVAGAYLLLCRLFHPHLALLAALLWAADPFLVAHSQLLHVDALLTSLMTVSLLAALVAFRSDAAEGPGPGQGAEHPAPPAKGRRGIRWDMLALSAITGGMAFLTKSPSAMLIPAIGVIALAGEAIHRQHTIPAHQYHPIPGAPHAPSRASVATFLAPLAVWGIIALLTWGILWPSAWVDLRGSVLAVLNEVMDNGAVPHKRGNFFLGQAMDDPGILFYPVAMVLRMTPWCMLGLIALVVSLLLSHRLAATTDHPVSGSRASIALLIFFVLLFMLPMSILPKKFDRYILPIFPTLNVLAAAGWLHLWTIVRQWSEQRQRTQQQRTHAIWPSSRWLVAAVGSLACMTVAWYHPYELAFYNPLLGGGPVAARSLLIGWNEGLEQAGAAIAARTSDCDRPVLAWQRSELSNDICQDVLNELETEPDPATMDYAVLYINQLQRHQGEGSINDFWGKIHPFQTIIIHGIPYAYLYDVVRADFGSHIYLHNSMLDSSQVRASGTLSLTLQWQPVLPLDTDYQVVIQVLDMQGETVSKIHQAPPTPTSTWDAGQVVVSTYRIPIAIDTPPGYYRIALGLYDPHYDTYLSPYQAAARSDVLDEGTLLLLKTIRLPLKPHIGSAFYLHGYEIDTASVRKTGSLRFHVKWQAQDEIEDITEDYVMFVQVLNDRGERIAQIDVPPGGPDMPPSTWKKGQHVAYTHNIPIPPGTPGGRYWVAMGIYHPQDLTRLPVRGVEVFPHGPAVGDGAILFQITLP